LGGSKQILRGKEQFLEEDSYVASHNFGGKQIFGNKEQIFFCGEGEAAGYISVHIAT